MYVRQERQRTIVFEVITGSCCRQEEEAGSQRFNPRPTARQQAHNNANMSEDA